MEEQQQVVPVRRRRGRAEAEQLAAAYEISGQSQADFCRSQGLSLATLARYRKRLQETGSGAGASGRWVAVEVAGAEAGKGDSGLAVALGGGRRIEVDRRFDARTLAQLVSVLERI
jgi:hypothetical protein